MREHISTPRRARATPSGVESTMTVRPVAPSLGSLAGAMAIWGLALIISVGATLASTTTRSPLVTQRPAANASSWAARPHVSLPISGTTIPLVLDR
jgi:hypothetical protein